MAGRRGRGEPGGGAGTPKVRASTPDVDTGAPQVRASTPDVDTGAPKVGAGAPKVTARTSPTPSTPVGPSPAPTRTATPSRERLHRGLTLRERRAQRRQALLDSALDLFGTKGYAATSIEELCRASFVSTRYFYEEFQNREDLLASLYEDLLARSWEAVLAAEVEPGPDYLRRDTRARVAAFVHALLDDPRAARIVCLEAVGVSPALEARRRAAHLRYAEALANFFLGYFPEGTDPGHDFQIVALGMVGAINEIIIDWMERDEPGSLDQLIDVVCEVFIVLGTSRWGSPRGWRGGPVR